ncbi:MAG: RNA methyltransferase [Cyclobacteriaceae bacterium]
MVSKNQAKFIKSLKIKKYRNKERCFLVEGRKNVLELIKSDFEVKWIVCTSAFASSNQDHLVNVPNDNILIASSSILTDLGTFSSNQDCLAVAAMRDRPISELKINNHLVVLDGVGDPGNLGTIIRTLDWFGLGELVCSTDTAEFYNPKVINATMGSFSRLKVYYTDIHSFLEKNNNVKILGADMGGADISNMKFDDPSIIVMGSESHGISKSVLSLLNQKIAVPGSGTAESLNVAMATGIIAYQFTRV